MPNWIINKLSFEGDEKRVEELMNKISTDEELIDFQKIIPRPKSLDITSGARTESTLEDGLITVENQRLYGHRDWYSWSIENWGTKWNTSETYLCDGEVVFVTAWSNPYPIILQLSQDFPDLLIKLKFADESIGSNCGEYHLKDSKVVYQTEYDDVEACILWGYDPVEMFEHMKRDKNINEILEDDNTDSSL